MVGQQAPISSKAITPGEKNHLTFRYFLSRFLALSEAPAISTTSRPVFRDNSAQYRSGMPRVRHMRMANWVTFVSWLRARSPPASSMMS